MTFKFDVKKYTGKWYELMHYPSFFQRNDNYNTTAEYTLVNNELKIVNSTIVLGQPISSKGVGKQIDTHSFRVDFEQPEINKLQQSGQFEVPKFKTNSSEPNYIIDHLWLDSNGEYIFAVVTDLNKNSLYVLSRTPYPTLEEYNTIMKYVVKNFNRDKLVQTPHY